MYLDPGFGSMIIQILIAGIAACGALLFAFKARVKAWWVSRKGKKTSQTKITSNFEKEGVQETQNDKEER